MSRAMYVGQDAMVLRMKDGLMCVCVWGGYYTILPTFIYV